MGERIIRFLLGQGSGSRPSVVSLFLLLSLVFAASSAALAEDNDPNDPESTKRMIRQADRMFRQASYESAAKILRNIVAADPNNTTAKLRLAHIMIRQRNVVEGYEMAMPIAQANPQNSYALAVVGTALLAAGRFSQARPLFFRAIQLNKREALAWSGFGMIDFYENRIEEGLLNLKEAVFHDPDHADYIYALAQVSARAERYRDAADAYERFLDVSKETDDERRARIKGLINFLRYLGNRVSLYTSTGAEATSVPFQLVGNRPILQVRINGRSEPLNFVLDTGSGISVLSEETARRLKVNAITRGGMAKGIGGDGRFEIVYGFLRELRIGDAQVKNVPVYIRKFHARNQQIDGYLGLSVISKFLTTVDYGELVFKLDKKDSLISDETKSLRSLPLRLTSSGFLTGEVTVDGVDTPLNFIVDTGASISVISTDLAEVEAIRSKEMPERMRVIGAAGITEDVRSFLLPKLSFGNHSRMDISAVALDLGLINEASGFEQAGILGGNFLRSYKLIFDFRNARIHFEPITVETPVTSDPLD